MLMKLRDTLFIQLLISCLLLYQGGGLVAQESAKDWTPLKNFNYTARTIDGKSINIDSLIRAGKKVVIDFAATYCNPCWTIHKRGPAERLWRKYGPDGSGEMYFIWVETTGASRREIEGHGSNTVGDWTNGGSIPYPIVSDSHMAEALGIPITHIPKIVLLSAHGTYTEVQEILYISEEGVYNKSKACLSAQDPPVIRNLEAPTWGMTTTTPCEVQAYVGSVAPISEYRWQVNGKDHTMTQEPRLLLHWDTAGDINISLTAVNRNGTSDPLTKRIQVRHSQTGGQDPNILIKESFERDCLFDWSRADIDGDLIGWTPLSQELKRLNVSEQQLSAKRMSHTGEDCMISWSLYPTEFRSYADLVGYRVKSQNWLLAPRITIPTRKDVDTRLVLYARSYSKQSKSQDTLSILYITGPVKPSTWQEDATKVLTTPISYNWQKVEYDLSAFRGQEIQLILAHETYGATGLLIDDVVVETTEHNSLSSPIDPAVRVFTYGRGIAVDTPDETHWSLYSSAGQLYEYGDLPGGYHRLDLETLPQGVYILRLTSPDGRQKYCCRILLP